MLVSAFICLFVLFFVDALLAALFFKLGWLLAVTDRQCLCNRKCWDQVAPTVFGPRTLLVYFLNLDSFLKELLFLIQAPPSQLCHCYNNILTQSTIWVRFTSHFLIYNLI